MKYPYGKTAVVTGASSGIGKAIAFALAKNGFTVYGGSRRGGENVSLPDSGSIIMCSVDVTSDESVKSFIDFVLEKERKIDILINAAGNGICGSIEECSSDMALYQFNTNYFGIIRVLNNVLPEMRKKRNGLIINVGSVGGLFSIPFQTHYSASKYAVEALTEGLRIEMRPYNVTAALVEPGDIKTGFTQARIHSDKKSVYGEEFRRSIAQMEKDEQNGKAPEVIANAVLKIIQRKNPPVRTVVGGTYKFFVFLKRILPAKTVESLLTAMYPKSKN